MKCVQCERETVPDGMDGWNYPDGRDAGMTECFFCKRSVCADCSLLEAEDLIGDDYVSVCFNCRDAFVQSVKQANTDAGEAAGNGQPVVAHGQLLMRLKLQGVVENYMVEHGEEDDPTAYQLAEVLGDRDWFQSTDWNDKGCNRCDLEPHTAWKPLLGKRIEISCCLTEVRKQGNGPRGNEFWYDSPILSHVKVLRLV